MDPNAVTDQKIKYQLGHLFVQTEFLQASLDIANARIAELEAELAAKAEPAPAEPAPTA